MTSLSFGGVLMGLADGETLTWRIREERQVAYDWLPGPWSDWRTVTRIQSPLTLVAPASGAVTGDRPVLDWTGPDYTIDAYQVEVARAGMIPIYGSNWYDWKAETGATSIRPGRLAPGVYRWRVRVLSGGLLDGGPWSEATFTVSGTATLQPTGPVAGATVRADDAVLTWDPWPAPPDYYSIMLGTTPDVTWDTAVYRGFSMSHYHPVTQLLPEGDLYWRVCIEWNCSDVVVLPGAGLVTDTAVQAGAEPARPTDAAAVSGAGTTSTESSTPRLLHVTPAPAPDFTPPVSAMTRVGVRAGPVLGSTGGIPARVSWSASDGGSGIQTQEVQVRRGSGSWTSIKVSASARSATMTLRPASTYTLRTRATDTNGNRGSWAMITLTTSLRQESWTKLRWSGRWKRTALNGASGGATRYATKAGSSVSTTLVARSMAIVAPRSKARGSATITIDGGSPIVVKLNASPTGGRRVVFAATWPTAGKHTVKVVVKGAAGHPRVDLDALVVLK
jgi:hypothetical protein